MISKNMAERLNTHMNEEFYSSYFYLAMSAYCQSISLNGFANWFSIQVQEENAHAMKFYQYLIDQDVELRLLAIKEPPSDFSSVTDAFEKTLAHEQLVTSLINDLVALSVEEKDFATHTFLQWFVTEQIEEEASVRDLLEQLKITGATGHGLLLLDRELALRTLAPPSASA